MKRSLVALCALNFFIADVRDGLGPFLGVFLQSNGWTPAEIGIVMGFHHGDSLLRIGPATHAYASRS